MGWDTCRIQQKEVLGKNERLKNNTIAIENNGYSLSNVEMETFIIKELIKMGKTFYLSDLKRKALARQNSITPIPVFP